MSFSWVKKILGEKAQEDQLDRSPEDRFNIGIDYVISRNEPSEDPYLMELQWNPGGHNGFSADSKPGNFFLTLDRKDLLVEALDQHMPENTLNSSEADRIAAENELVVSKGALGARGNNMHIGQEPKPHHEIVEEFIEPDLMKLKGEERPYIVRDEIEIKVNGEEVDYERVETFSKRSLRPDDELKPEDYVFNTASPHTEKTRKVPNEEEIHEKTEKVIQDINYMGTKSGWDPTNYFEPIILRYYSNSKNTILPQKTAEIEEELEKRDIEYRWTLSTGDLEKSVREAEYGADILIIPNTYSPRMPGGMKATLDVEIGEEGIILNNRFYPSETSTIETPENVYHTDSSTEEIVGHLIDID